MSNSIYHDIDSVLTYTDLPSGSYSFPNTEVAQDPSQQQTQDKLPSQATDVLNPLRYSQNPSPERKHTTNMENL